MSTSTNNLQPGTKIRTNGTLGTPRWLVGHAANIAARTANADGIIKARLTRDRGNFTDVFYTVEHAPGAPVAPYRSTEFEVVQTEGELEGCIIQTIDSVRTELEALEEILAARFNLTGDVRAQLFELDRANGLVEDDVVADWHCTLAIFLDTERYEARAAAEAALRATPTPFCPSRLLSPDPLAVDCKLGCCRRAGFPCDPTWNVANYCADLLAEMTAPPALPPIKDQWGHAAYLDGKLSVYPGHPLTIAYIISVAFASLDEALAPPKHGGDFPAHEALADCRIPGAGGEVWGGITLLERLRDGEISIEDAVARADEHWHSTTENGYIKERAAGQAQADKVKLKLAEIVAFARGGALLKKSA